METLTSMYIFVNFTICRGNLFFLQGQGKVREFCKIAREIRKSSKVREKSGPFF